MQALRIGTLFACWLLLVNAADAQHNWQKPSPLMDRAEIQKLVGKVGKAPFAKPRHLVWVWGYDAGHRPGNHDYTRIRDLMVGLLKKVPKLTVETAYLFPTKEQFERADLVVMYLHLPGLTDAHYALLDPYLERGGGLVAIHETMIQRPRAFGHQWAERIGLGWSEGKSQWGAMFTRIYVDTMHPIFENFPERVDLVDEFYWHLAKTKKRGAQTTLASVPVGPPGSSRGPIDESKLSRERHPVFWTMKFGKGRVFCSLPGHNAFLFFDPKFRILLLRGFAWAMNEKADPLMPLVYDGIEKDGKFGTTDTMRTWKNKPRNLKAENLLPPADGLPPGHLERMVNVALDQRLGLGPKPKREGEAIRPKVKHIIDTHIHLYDTSRKEGVPWPPKADKTLYKPHLPEEFARVSNPTGVDGVVIVEASDRLADNKWVLDLVKDKPLFVGLVGNIDPYLEDFGDQLDKLRLDARFVGIRARLTGKKIDYRHPQVVANFRLLAKAGLSLDILMNGEGVETIREIDRLARTIPDCRIIVNHVLGYNIDGRRPPKKWIDAVENLAKNKNVYVKISGLYQRSTKRPAPRNPDFYQPLLDILWKSFGSKRLIYGSNWPVTKWSGDYASYVEVVNAFFADKDQEARENYFWRNAVRAYRLNVK